MGNFNRNYNSRDDRRGGFDRNRRSFRGDRQMYDAVCSNCGKNCQVPFKPTGNKPVYCSDCFERMGGKDDRRSFDRPRREERNFPSDTNKVQLDSINAKLDKILNLLQPKETPTVSPQEEVKTETPKEKKVKTTRPKKVSKVKENSSKG